jgi:hypothetical protein
LVVFSMLDLMYTAADNAQFHAICQRANWLPGIRSDKRPCAEATDIQFIDVRYTRPDFARHLAMVRRFRPRYATVPDLSEREVSREDIRRALRQAELLAPHCGVVLLVPKLPGQIGLLPGEAAIGYSVPTRYGAPTMTCASLKATGFTCWAAAPTGSWSCIAISRALPMSGAWTATCFNSSAGLENFGEAAGG